MSHSSRPQRRRCVLSGAVLLALAYDSDNPVSPQSLDLNAERRALASADSSHAAVTSRGLLAGMPTAWTEDVALLWPTLPVSLGRARALATLQSLSGAAQRTMTWYPVRIDVSADATHGYSYGYGTRTAPGASGPVTTSIQYIAYWVKDEAATWRVRAWTFNTAVPPLPTAAPVGCETPRNASALPAPGSSSALALTQVLRADSAFAAQAAVQGAEPAFRANAASDAAAVGGGERIVCGAAAAAALFAGPPGALTWAPQFGGAAESGDLGFTVGLARGEGAVPSFTKYLTVWRRQANGEWMFVADGGNAAPTP